MHSPFVRALYLHQLRDLYAAQRHLVRALPQLIRASTDLSLRRRLTLHLEQTKGQLVRLERIFEALDQGKGSQTNQSMAELIRQGETASAYLDVNVRDLALIAAVQQFEHYELAGYRAALTSALLLQEEDAALLLDASLQEASATDDQLIVLSTSTARKALHGSDAW
ncbi:ferritin-like domain-containing protein [Deinococcus oregonensis]|uniref:Ferritin-like domain-containing protein n=1 Tax=Deinococcus oregonensis TaxID=1805970 RepID=A0ABV6B0Y7_9DEIO